MAEIVVKRFVAFSVCLFVGVAFAQHPGVKSGATVYIQPMGGYEAFLGAAIQKEKVPLTVVVDKKQADYILTSKLLHTDLSGPVNVNVIGAVNNSTPSTPASTIETAMQQGAAEGAAERRAMGETQAAITMIDVHSSQIVFSYAVGKMGKNQVEATAEACAKRLRKFIDKSEKHQK